MVEGVLVLGNRGRPTHEYMDRVGGDPFILMQVREFSYVSEGVVTGSGGRPTYIWREWGETHLYMKRVGGDPPD